MVFEKQKAGRSDRGVIMRPAHLKGQIALFVFIDIDENQGRFVMSGIISTRNLFVAFPFFGEETITPSEGFFVLMKKSDIRQKPFAVFRKDLRNEIFERNGIAFDFRQNPFFKKGRVRIKESRVIPFESESSERKWKRSAGSKGVC
jgi:hypothetical protein